MYCFCKTLINSFLLPKIMKKLLLLAVQFLIRPRPEVHDKILASDKQTLRYCNQIFADIVFLFEVPLVFVNNAHMFVRD